MILICTFMLQQQQCIYLPNLQWRLLSAGGLEILISSCGDVRGVACKIHSLESFQKLTVNNNKLLGEISNIFNFLFSISESFSFRFYPRPNPPHLNKPLPPHPHEKYSEFQDIYWQNFPVSVCQQNVRIWLTPPPPKVADVINERPLMGPCSFITLLASTLPIIIGSFSYFLR